MSAFTKHTTVGLHEPRSTDLFNLTLDNSEFSRQQLESSKRQQLWLKKQKRTIITAKKIKHDIIGEWNWQGKQWGTAAGSIALMDRPETSDPSVIRPDWHFATSANHWRQRAVQWLRRKSIELLAMDTGKGAGRRVHGKWIGWQSIIAVCVPWRSRQPSLGEGLTSPHRPINTAGQRLAARPQFKQGRPQR